MGFLERGEDAGDKDKDAEQRCARGESRYVSNHRGRITLVVPRYKPSRE